MHEDVPTKAIAACFGLAAFVIVIIVGLMVGNPAEETLTRAVPAMIACTIVGYIIGSVTTGAISGNIQAAARDASAAATQAAEEAARIRELEGDVITPPGGATSARSTGAKPAAAKAVSPSTQISTPARATGSPRKAAA
ncbi:MAG: hypothetical protein Q8L55_09925 [Phycisphaerales bacterium]|nr:hypothetical protein [Phycisphaerales bacterium]